MPTPQWYEADTDDEDRHALRDAIARLEKRDDERDDLRAEVERLRALMTPADRLLDEAGITWQSRARRLADLLAEERATVARVHSAVDEWSEGGGGSMELCDAVDTALAGGVAADAPTPDEDLDVVFDRAPKSVERFKLTPAPTSSDGGCVMDFPTAFAIASATPTEYHHDKCSHRAGILCDCHVLTKGPQYLADYGDDCECGCNDEASR